MLGEGGKVSPRLILALVLLLLSCGLISGGIVLLTRGDEPEVSERPSCVTLPVYSSVIEQVMGIYPNWDRLRATRDGFETTWTIHAERATHRLTAALTKNECVCATRAASSYPSGSPQAEFAGLLQGAAVAPISDLEYTTRWLEPKILTNCTLAFVGRDQYLASETMRDGTAWALECGRPAAPAYADLELSLRVTTPQCQEPIQ